MSATHTAPCDHPRGEARRAQILDAAADCFRNHGFHGASIAQISKSAGMSAGHIYHYFANKEAIIAAIVERDLERILSLAAELRSAGNVLQAMLDCAAEGIRCNLDPKSGGRTAFGGQRPSGNARLRRRGYPLQSRPQIGRPAARDRR